MPDELDQFADESNLLEMTCKENSIGVTTFTDTEFDESSDGAEDHAVDNIDVENVDESMNDQEVYSGNLSKEPSASELSFESSCQMLTSKIEKKDTLVNSCSLKSDDIQEIFLQSDDDAFGLDEIEKPIQFGLQSNPVMKEVCVKTASDEHKEIALSIQLNLSINLHTNSSDPKSCQTDPYQELENTNLAKQMPTESSPKEQTDSGNNDSLGIDENSTEKHEIEIDNQTGLIAEENILRRSSAQVANIETAQGTNIEANAGSIQSARGSIHSSIDGLARDHVELPKTDDNSSEISRLATYSDETLRVHAGQDYESDVDKKSLFEDELVQAKQTSPHSPHGSYSADSETVDKITEPNQLDMKDQQGDITSESYEKSPTPSIRGETSESAENKVPDLAATVHVAEEFDEIANLLGIQSKESISKASFEKTTDIQLKNDGKSIEEVERRCSVAHGDDSIDAPITGDDVLLCLKAKVNMDENSENPDLNDLMPFDYEIIIGDIINACSQSEFETRPFVSSIETSEKTCHESKLSGHADGDLKSKLVWNFETDQEQPTVASDHFDSIGMQTDEHDACDDTPADCVHDATGIDTIEVIPSTPGSSVQEDSGFIQLSKLVQDVVDASQNLDQWHNLFSQVTFFSNHLVGN
jgi:hypothetical protein